MFRGIETYRPRFCTSSLSPLADTYVSVTVPKKAAASCAVMGTMVCVPLYRWKV